MVLSHAISILKYQNAMTVLRRPRPGTPTPPTPRNATVLILLLPSSVLIWNLLHIPDSNWPPRHYMTSAEYCMRWCLRNAGVWFYARTNVQTKLDDRTGMAHQNIAGFVTLIEVLFLLKNLNTPWKIQIFYKYSMYI